LRNKKAIEELGGISLAIRGKLLYVLSLVAVILLVVSLLGVLLSFIAPGAPFIYGMPPFYWGWLFVDLLAYIVAIATLFIAGISLERVIRGRIPAGLSHLKSSMAATGVGVVAATIFVFALLFNFIGFDITLALAGFALPFAIIPSLIAWLISPALINISYGCKHDPNLQKIVDRVAARAGIDPPKAMIAEVPIPNAFAYSSPVMGRFVAVTRGLLNSMNEQELEAVVGHELGHHRHRDNTVMLVFGMFPSLMYYLGRYLMLIGMYTGLYRDGGERRRGGGEGIILLLIGVVLVIVSILIQLAVLALSRMREYYADAHGAKVTSPATMISALQSLEKFYGRYRSARNFVENSKIRALFIYAFAEPFIGLEELLSTHPPTYKRIEFLKTLAYTDLAEV
jgi:heat shock protein HtpX